ncbi:MAG: SprT family zinc-dependent metalloprotease [Candidatus Saccharimonadales bacterium]
MTQKTVYVEGLGELVLAKRKGVRRLKLSIKPNGQIRVSLPAWVPYAAALSFAKSQADWISKHRIHSQLRSLQPGDQIGPSHRLVFDYDPATTTVSSRITSSTVRISSGLLFNHPKVQQKATAAAEKVLKNQASRILPARLDQFSKHHGLPYKSVKVRKLTARWGSCSSDKVITLSYYLLQLPLHLQDYVMLHELVHTKHLHHGQNFWSAFDSILPNAKKIRKEIRQHKPRIEPVSNPL